jgi:hypothetical protein
MLFFFAFLPVHRDGRVLRETASDTPVFLADHSDFTIFFASDGLISPAFLRILIAMGDVPKFWAETILDLVLGRDLRFILQISGVSFGYDEKIIIFPNMSYSKQFRRFHNGCNGTTFFLYNCKLNILCESHVFLRDILYKSILLLGSVSASNA